VLRRTIIRVDLIDKLVLNKTKVIKWKHLQFIHSTIARAMMSENADNNDVLT